MIYTKRRPIPTVPRSTAWRARMRRTRTRAVTCSKTFIYSCGAASGILMGDVRLERVAHNVATGHVVRQRRIRKTLATIEEIEAMPSNDQSERVVSEKQALERLSMLIQLLKPLDRQIIISYLEGMDANSTAEITGLSAANVAMKVHRIKTMLKRWFNEGASHAG